MAFITSQNPVMSQGLAEAILAALSTRPSTALLATPTVHLFTAGPSPILPTSKTTDFTEATFTGYAAVVQSALLGPINLPPPDGYGVHAESDFLATPSGSFVGAVIAGYWVDNGSTTFYYGEYFKTPIPIVNPGDFVSLDVIWGQPVFLTVV